MARQSKTKERLQAHTLYNETSKSQKEIAEIVGVTEKTVSRWAIDGGWENERNARLMSNDSIKRNGKMAMDNNFQILLELQEKRRMEMAKPQPDKIAIRDIDKEILGYTHAIAQAKNSVEEILSQSKITLILYLQVMDDIFNALKLEEPKIHAQTLDFQERHIQYIAKKLG